MWDGSHAMNWWMAFWMVLASIAWVGLMALLVYSVTGGLDRSRSGATGKQEHEAPLEIARRRYASGELTEEEYARVRENLR